MKYEQVPWNIEIWISALKYRNLNKCLEVLKYKQDTWNINIQILHREQ